MSALVCFAVFLAGVAVCLHMGWALIWAMLLGIAAFGALGLRRGFSLRTLWSLLISGSDVSSSCVIRVNTLVSP